MEAELIVCHPNFVSPWTLRHINRNIGYVQGTVEHLFHGRKTDRGNSRAHD